MVTGEVALRQLSERRCYGRSTLNATVAVALFKLIRLALGTAVSLEDYHNLVVHRQEPVLLFELLHLIMESRCRLASGEYDVPPNVLPARRTSIKKGHSHKHHVCGSVPEGSRPYTVSAGRSIVTATTRRSGVVRVKVRVPLLASTWIASPGVNSFLSSARLSGVSIMR